MLMFAAPRAPDDSTETLQYRVHLCGGKGRASVLVTVEKILPSIATVTATEITKIGSHGMWMFAAAPRVADDRTDALQDEQHMFPARLHNHKTECYCVSCTELTSLMTCIGGWGKVWMVLDMNAASAQ